jgi:hypothetical protein
MERASPLTIVSRRGSETDTSAGGSTVIRAVPVRPAVVAVIVAVPIALALATPVPSMAAIVGSEDVHVHDAGGTVTLPSVIRVPVTVNCCVRPLGTIAPVGERASEAGTAGRTETSVRPTTVPTVADTVTVPTPAAVTTPTVSAVAILGSDEDQLAPADRSRVVPSSYRPIAVSLMVRPFGSSRLTGVNPIDARAGSLLRPVPQASPPTARSTEHRARHVPERTRDADRPMAFSSTVGCATSRKGRLP